MPLTARGTRCPACGFLLASAPGPVYQNSLRPKRPRPASGARSALPGVIAIGGVLATFAVAVGGFVAMRKQDDARAAKPIASVVVSAAPAPSAAPVLEPTALFAKAKSKALAWHTDATLIEIDIAPVLLGKVDPTGKLEFVFGKPAGKKLGPGNPVQGTEFVVTAGASGVEGTERSTGKAVSVAEPNCIFEDVLVKVANAGVSSGERLRFHYAMSEKHARAVWRVSRDGEAGALRTLDGANCAIIIH